MDEPTIPLPELFGGRYERGPMLGRGGMAAVFRARDRRLERDVALKVALPSGGVDAATRARAAREARVLAALEDPRVVRVLDAGEEAGLPYLVMELIEGTSLAERLRTGPLEPAEAARIGAAVAGGLAAVHAQGLVHRDVKPDNVLLLADGGVRLVDFGIARQDAVSDGTTATAPGIVIGTPGYIAPEVFQGVRPDARADVYALGVTLHRALAGAVPAPPAALAALLDELAAPEPGARPTAADAERRLGALAEPAAPTLLMPVIAAGRRRRRRRAVALWAAGAAALALALGIVRAGGGGDAPPPSVPSLAATLPAATTPAAAAPTATSPTTTSPTTIEVASTAAGGEAAAREARKSRDGKEKRRGGHHHKGD
ncbi:MAG: eukaryotic-like serine/threonine-protein kinase [Miltoncostaeaceae bacterium]|nr:eukaryotic-like serine/threonine-protein kinase [Miltoncostaeaceae bacterium]